MVYRDKFVVATLRSAFCNVYAKCKFMYMYVQYVLFAGTADVEILALSVILFIV